MSREGSGFTSPARAVLAVIIARSLRQVLPEISHDCVIEATRIYVLMVDRNHVDLCCGFQSRSLW